MNTSMNSATRRSLLASTFLLTFGSSPDAAKADGAVDGPPLTTVERVELDRYVGVWYEIAKIPNRFQKKCVSGTTATYTRRDDGRIEVVNRCLESDGSPDEAKGVAKIVDRETNAKLEVSFVSFLGWRPFWGDYWVIGLDDDYQWAIVGTPDRKYGWVLARTAQLDKRTLEQIFSILERKGYTRDVFELSRP